MRALMHTVLTLAVAAGLLTSCGEESGSVPEVPPEELAAEVPELDAVHEHMQPVWHEAFPAGNVDAIVAAIPEFERTLTDLDQAELPGILQDKEDRWNTQKELLMETFEGLKAAAESGDEEEVLAYTEAFHMNYEGMVRIIRPVVPELEAFHQHLYGLYHYYGPGYDLEKMRQSARDMAAAVPPLRAAELPSNLADHQEHFEMEVDELGQAVGNLMAALDDPDRAEVEEAVETVHSAYQDVEAIFDAGSTMGDHG